MPEWSEILDKLKMDLADLIVNVTVIVIVLIVAKLVLNRLSRTTQKVIDKAKNDTDSNRSKDLITSMTLLRSVGRYGIYFVAVSLIINQLGYGNVLTNVVTAAGVGALAISFAAQSILTDLIAGMFIMFEKQYRVGDYVAIAGYEGTVTSIAMRCTYLTSWKGEKIIIPNGQISSVVNYSTDYNMAVVHVPTPYDIDTEKVTEIITEVARQYCQNNPDLCRGEPNVVPVTAYNDSNIQISVYIKTAVRKQYTVQNQLRYQIKQRFDQEKISIPFPQVDVHQR